MSKYRNVQKKVTVLLSTSLAWLAVAGCSQAEPFSQLSAISFAQPCTSETGRDVYLKPDEREIDATRHIFDSLETLGESHHQERQVFKDAF